jgi:hypothetical protein
MAALCVFLDDRRGSPPPARDGFRGAVKHFIARRLPRPYGGRTSTDKLEIMEVCIVRKLLIVLAISAGIVAAGSTTSGALASGPHPGRTVAGGGGVHPRLVAGGGGQKPRLVAGPGGYRPRLVTGGGSGRNPVA